MAPQSLNGSGLSFQKLGQLVPIDMSVRHHETNIYVPLVGTLVQASLLECTSKMRSASDPSGHQLHSRLMGIMQVQRFCGFLARDSHAMVMDFLGGLMGDLTASVCLQLLVGCPRLCVEGQAHVTRCRGFNRDQCGLVMSVPRQGLD